jgi:hypothetical protein
MIDTLLELSRPWVDRLRRLTLSILAVISISCLCGCQMPYISTGHLRANIFDNVVRNETSDLQFAARARNEFLSIMPTGTNIAAIGEYFENAGGSCGTANDGRVSCVYQNERRIYSGQKLAGGACITWHTEIIYRDHKLIDLSINVDFQQLPCKERV